MGGMIELMFLKTYTHVLMFEHRYIYNSNNSNNSLLNYFWTDICINGKSNGGAFYYNSILLKCYEHFLIQNNQIGNF